MFFFIAWKFSSSLISPRLNIVLFPSPLVANIHDPSNNETSLERVNKADTQSIDSILLYLHDGENEGEI